MWSELRKTALELDKKPFELLDKKPWKMTENEIRDRLHWSKESERLFELLNSVDNENNRRGYVPLEDSEVEFLITNGYLKKGRRKSFTEKGANTLNELKRIYHEWNMIMGSRYDTVQMLVDEGQYVSPEVLKEYEGRL